MKKIKIVSIILVFTFCCQGISAQLNLLGASTSIAHINDNVSGLKTNLKGLNAFVEIPLQTYSIRAEYSYYVPMGCQIDNMQMLDQLSILHLYGGKVLGQGHRFQFPVFVGLGRYISKGDLNFKNLDVGAKLGIRMYLTSRISLFTDLSAHFIFAPKFNYIDNMGMRQTSNLAPLSAHLNIGVAYTYSKS